MKKRLFSLVLALLMVGSLMAIPAQGAEGGFTKVRSYTEGQFTDVSATRWFAGAVKDCYELGLMSGSSETTFNPNGTFTLAEALTVAARLHNLYHGGDGTIPTVPGKWYNGAVQYCQNEGIIKKNQFAGRYSDAATRTEMVQLVYGALKDAPFAEINQVDTLPDVSVASNQGREILLFYRAGILTGTGEYGTFQPYSSITRAEVATILARVALPEQRVTRTLKAAQTSQEALPIYTWNYNDATMSCGRMAFCDTAEEKAKDAKWGYLDMQGNVVIPAQYAYAGTFRNGHAVVADAEGRKGIIDVDGKVVVPIEFKSITLITGKKNDRMAGVYDQQVEGLTQEYYLVKNSDGYGGLYRSNGTRLFEPTYESIKILGDDSVQTTMQGNGYYVNGRYYINYVRRLWISGKWVDGSESYTISIKVPGQNYYAAKKEKSGWAILEVSNGALRETADLGISSSWDISIKDGIWELNTAEQGPRRYAYYSLDGRQKIINHKAGNSLVVTQENGKYYIETLGGGRISQQGFDDSDRISLREGASVAVASAAPNGYDTVYYVFNASGLVGEYTDQSEASRVANDLVAMEVEEKGPAFVKGTVKLSGTNPDGVEWYFTQDGNFYRLYVGDKVAFSETGSDRSSTWSTGLTSVRILTDGSIELAWNYTWDNVELLMSYQETRYYNSYTGSSKTSTEDNPVPTQYEEWRQSENKDKKVVWVLEKVTVKAFGGSSDGGGGRFYLSDDDYKKIKTPRESISREEIGRKVIDWSDYDDCRGLGEGCYIVRKGSNWYMKRI